MFLRLFFLLVFGLLSGAAHAEEYAQASWPNLIRTLVRFNAINLSDPGLIDEYAIITECDLYKAFYHDDFKWNQVRQAVTKSVQMNVATFPMNYRYDLAMQLDRYDFAAKLFRFREKSTLRNVNTFSLYSIEGTGCGAGDVKMMPRHFRVVLAAPVYMDGLPLGEKDAESLLKKMEASQNTDRIIYARFHFRIVYIDPLRKIAAPGEVTRYQQSNAVGADGMRLDARLDTIDFYDDPERTHLIYEFQS